MPYVVTEPEFLRGIYDSWADCQTMVAGVAGIRLCQVTSHEEGEAILAGRGVVLPPGLYAFTDGNALGGVGLVIVHIAEEVNADPKVMLECATSVDDVFNDAQVPGLKSREAVHQALGRIHNILAELAALYAALSKVEHGAEVTIVHDYVGVGAWMQGKWRAKHPIVKIVLGASRKLCEEKGLELHFVHQPGHRSTCAGRQDLARFNGRADELATEGANPPAG